MFKNEYEPPKSRRAGTELFREVCVIFFSQSHTVKFIYIYAVSTTNVNTVQNYTSNYTYFCCEREQAQAAPDKKKKTFAQIVLNLFKTTELWSWRCQPQYY